MDSAVPGRLEGWEIHGFRTMEDLDIGNMMEEAKARWLRPNEIHAVLFNYEVLSSYKCFHIHVKPVNLPKSGTIVLFDRKMLRNFRKDGHNWKKKKDGKTVKEAHEHLKVGDEERIHVYYAHGEDKPTFVRRCYWLLDKTLEHIVLVHYRETQEGSPITPVNSNYSAAFSDLSATWTLSEETDSGADPNYYTADKAQLVRGDSMTLKNHEMRLHEINTLEWEELLVPDDPNNIVGPEKPSCFEQQNPLGTNEFMNTGMALSSNKVPTGDPLGSLFGPISQSNTCNNLFQQIVGQTNSDFQKQDTKLVNAGTGDFYDAQGKDGLQSQDSFGRWMNSIISDSPGSVDDPILEPSIPADQEFSSSTVINQLQSAVTGQIFNITDVSPAWAFSSEATKILITGFFYGEHPLLEKPNIYCVCGDACSPVEIVQSGVFRCLVSPHPSGFVNLYLSIDGCNPISQVMTFEYRTPLMHQGMISKDDEFKWEEFRVQMRLARLLFSSSKSLSILSGKLSPNALKEAKNFARKASHIADGWAHMVESIENNTISFQQAKDSLFELTLKNRLYEWLLERVIEGRKTFECDDQGQGIIHLCAILDYTWVVYPFSKSGLSLDFRDKHGWTALHWAAYHGREKMVAALLSAGAKPNLVSDPTSESPGGCIAADLASKQGHDGLAAYLAEKALVAHFEDMKIAGNASGSLQTTTPDSVNPSNLSEDELYLKDTLAAYRTAADAAARIHAAFRENSLKQRTKAIQFSSPEDEARNIIAAMKIQHAFRSYEARKKMAAAARIQLRFRSWKIRKEFLKLRRQTIKIQCAFRGYQARKQYKKIVWSVGVLEKAILRWRLRRKGFRGIQVNPVEDIKPQDEDGGEEDFFRVSREEAEKRMDRAVVKVQAMFRSKKAQEEYQRMKLAHSTAQLEYELNSSDNENNMG
ncbi:hypothetical protein NMG60_11025017 [Bertholletia excelsa]